MVLSSTLDYITQPLEAVDINILRNAAICGITALVIVMVGLSKLLVLVLYFLIIGIIAAVTWLYSLERLKRVMVVERIKEVFNSFMQTCVDQVLRDTNDRTPGNDSSCPAEEGCEGEADKQSNINWKASSTQLNKNVETDYSGLFE